MNTRLRTYLALTLLLVGVLMTSTQVMAQATPTVTPAVEFEITGTVDAVSTGAITLSGQVIQITGAQITGTITVGAVVKAHVSVAADGSLVAREIELVPLADQTLGVDEMEIIGVVQALTADSITIGGRVFDISAAEIKDPIEVGSLVKIHFSAASTGDALVAREVELARIRIGAGDDEDAGQDLTDDHGDDGPGHDQGDDHGGDDHSDSGRGGDDGGGDDHGGHGGDD